MILLQFSSVQLLSRVQLFATPWTAARQASLSITNSRSPPKPMSIESVMPSSHLLSVIPFSSCPQSFPASGSFQMSQLFASGGQSIGVSASTSVLPMNIQDLSNLGWTGWIYNKLFINKGHFLNNRMPGLLSFLKKWNHVLSYVKDFVKAYRLNQSILGMHNTYSYHGTFGQWGKMMLVV